MQIHSRSIAAAAPIRKTPRFALVTPLALAAMLAAAPIACSRPGANAHRPDTVILVDTVLRTDTINEDPAHAKPHHGAKPKTHT